MAQIKSLFGDIKVETANNGGFILSYGNDSQYCVTTNNEITKSGDKLSFQEVQNIHHDILKSEFGIPSVQKIEKLKEKFSSPEVFQIEIHAQHNEEQTELEFSVNGKSADIKRKSIELKQQSINQSSKTKTNSSYILSPIKREYSQTSKVIEYIPGDKIHSYFSIVTKRNISSNGKNVNLEYEKKSWDEFDMDNYENKVSIEISEKEIVKKTTLNSHDKKMQIKTSYDLRTGKIHSKMKETIYDAMNKTEFKQTLLTLFTHKKYPSTFSFDYNFKGELEIDENGNSIYKVSHTTPDCSEENFVLNNDSSKINSDMVREVEQLKEIAKKISIIKNSQQNSEVIDFSINPSIFDSEISFEKLSDKSDVVIVSNFTNTSENLHKDFLFAINSALKQPQIPLHKIKEYS